MRRNALIGIREKYQIIFQSLGMMHGRQGDRIFSLPPAQSGLAFQLFAVIADMGKPLIRSREGAGIFLQLIQQAHKLLFIQASLTGIFSNKAVVTDSSPNIMNSRIGGHFPQQSNIIPQLYNPFPDPGLAAKLPGQLTKIDFGRSQLLPADISSRSVDDPQIIASGHRTCCDPHIGKNILRDPVPVKVGDTILHLKGNTCFHQLL